MMDNAKNSGDGIVFEKLTRNMSRRPTTACSRPGYRCAPAKALVILAGVARECSGNTRPTEAAKNGL